jgi:hypothetical protein
MRVQLPDPGERYDGQLLRHLMQVLRRAFNSALSSDEAAPRMLLRSPGGKTFQVTVDDTGTLQVSQVSGGGV